MAKGDGARPNGSARDDALTRLRAHMAAGNYAPGDRLPPERELIGALGLTRAALRKALETLEREGRIWRHVGKGTFVADGGGAPAPEPAAAELGRRMTPFQMMRARLTVEPGIAREAAVSGSAASLARIRAAMDSAHASTSWAEYERQDDRFHRAVAAACENELLLELFDRLNTVRRAVAWGNVTRQTEGPGPGHASFAEHEAIAEALERRDAEGAYAAMRTHLRSVSARLFEGE